MNCHEYMDKTNLIGDVLKDIWTVEGVPRNHVKKAYTPTLYGSAQSYKSLWDKNKLEYTQVQLNKINALAETGTFSYASKFKEFIINNVKPQELMEVSIWNDTFMIECNRFKWEETKEVNYSVYSSGQGLFKPVSRKVALVPDVNQFKRYFVTLLIHNLDSQVADFISLSMDWCIPIHDAFIVHPNDVAAVKDIYTMKMKEIYDNRKEILSTYFNCVGISKTFKEIDDTEISSFKHTCLK